jgi:hypothetical protein
MDVAGMEKLSFVYAKVMRFALLGFIEPPDPSHWRGGKLRVRRGEIGRRRVRMRGEFFTYLSARADACAAAIASLSGKQREITQRVIDQNQADFVASETLLAMAADAAHFGTSAVTWEDD